MPRALLLVHSHSARSRRDRRPWRAVVVSLLSSFAFCAAAQEPASTPGVPPTAVPQTQAPQTPSAPIAALLLPLDAPEFAPAANALAQGFVAAQRVARNSLLVATLHTDASPQRILAEYDRAVAGGAAVVVGPLTRSGVTALATGDRIRVPTVALNQPDEAVKMPPSMLLFGLNVEAEARMLARIEVSPERVALIVAQPNAIARRIAAAFRDEWSNLGGWVSDSIEVGTLDELDALRKRVNEYGGEMDMIFLAAEHRAARRIRPYLGAQVPVYSTSMAVDPRATPDQNFDLSGLHFTDMPWFLQPDHPAVKLYPRPKGMSAELERFYALGIDAYRVAEAIALGKPVTNLDGVTGALTLHDGVIERMPIEAMYQDGIPVLERGNR